jgi:hypothetical protein
MQIHAEIIDERDKDNPFFEYLAHGRSNRTTMLCWFCIASSSISGLQLYALSLCRSECDADHSVTRTRRYDSAAD